MKKYFELFKFEFTSKLTGMVMWSLIWILIAALTLAFYDSLIANLEGLMELLKSFPKEMLAAMGTDLESITKIEGFVNSRILTLSLLVGGIWAGWQGSQLVGRDESTGVMNWLATQPLSRSGIFLSKFLAATLWLFIVNMVIMIVIIFLCDVLTSVEVVPVSFFLQEGVGLTIYYLFMFSIGNLFAVFFSEDKGRLAAVVLVMSNFTVNLVRAFENSPEFVKYFTTYYYFDTEKFVKEGNLDAKVLVLFAAFIILSIITLFKFQTKDIGD